MGRLLAVVQAVCLLVLGMQSVQAQDFEPRIALIVGNGAYGGVAPLDNPVPDAAEL